MPMGGSNPTSKMENIYILTIQLFITSHGLPPFQIEGIRKISFTNLICNTLFVHFQVTMTMVVQTW